MQNFEFYIKCLANWLLSIWVIRVVLKNTRSFWKMLFELNLKNGINLVLDVYGLLNRPVDVVLNASKTFENRESSHYPLNHVLWYCYQSVQDYGEVTITFFVWLESMLSLTWQSNRKLLFCQSGLSLHKKIKGDKWF